MLRADQKSNPHSDAADYDADQPDNHTGEEDEDEDAMGTDPRFNRSDIRLRQRTRVLWLESDDLRLLAYRKDMTMG